MRKLLTALAVVLSCCTVFTACGDKSPTEDGVPAIYFFSGENEQFTLPSGVIVLTDTEEVFYVDRLEAKPGQLTDITSLTITFYVLSDDGKEVLLSNSFVDQTGKAIGINGMKEMKIAGDIPAISRADIDELQNDFYCELEATDLNGEKTECLMQLTLKAVHGTNGS